VRRFSHLERLSLRDNPLSPGKLNAALEVLPKKVRVE